MRYTEYHNGVAVIKDKALLKGAMQKLAEYEDEEEELELRKKIFDHCASMKDCDECKLDNICDGYIRKWEYSRLKEVVKLIIDVD